MIVTSCRTTVSPGHGQLAVAALFAGKIDDDGARRIARTVSAVTSIGAGFARE